MKKTIFLFLSLFVLFSFSSPAIGNTNKIWICHVPPGNIANAHAINVDANSWDGHNHHENDFIISSTSLCPPPPPLPPLVGLTVGVVVGLIVVVGVVGVAVVVGLIVLPLQLPPQQLPLRLPPLKHINPPPPTAHHHDVSPEPVTSSSSIDYIRFTG